MNKLIDAHTHHPIPYFKGIVDISDMLFEEDFEKRISEIPAEQLFSVGIHPWSTSEEITDVIWNRLESAVSDSRCVAIGECGVDVQRGAPLYKQLLIFKRQIDLSERLGKIMIIHEWRSDDIICGLRRDMRVAQPWIIHGYRGKPGGVAMLLRSGCYISFGSHYNSETIKSVSQDRILSETDESDLPIEDIIAQQSSILNLDLTPIVSANLSHLIDSKN